MRHLFDRAWRDLVPTLEFFALPKDDAARTAFIDSEAARALPRGARRRTCRSARMSRQDTAALAPADGLQARSTGLRLGLAPDAPRRAPRCPRQKPRSAQAIAGTWTRSLGDYGEQRWVFRRGTLTIDGKPQGRYVTKRPGELFIDDDGNTTQHWFARVDRDHFFAADPGIHCAHDLTNTRVLLEWRDVLVIRGDTCKALSPYGGLSDATCTRKGGDLGSLLPLVARRSEGCRVASHRRMLRRFRSRPVCSGALGDATPQAILARQSSTASRGCIGPSNGSWISAFMVSGVITSTSAFSPARARFTTVPAGA